MTYCVPIHTHRSSADVACIEVAHCVLRIGMLVVLDKAEATRRLLEAVKAHDDVLHDTDGGEQLVHDVFVRSEGEVPNVHCRGGG